MNEYTLYAIVKLKVKSELSEQEVIDYLGNNGEYNFHSVEGCEIVDTEYMELATNYET